MTWLFIFLLAGALSADPPVFVMAPAAGYIPGNTSAALQQHLVQPLVVAYDPDGNLYYGTSHQIWRLNPDASFSLIAGNGSGTASPSGDGGPATGASLGWVGGLAIDAHQNVYISDLSAYEIRKVTPAGTIVRFAGTGAPPLYGAQSNAASGTPAQKVPLNPGSLAIDTTNLYVSDSGTSSVLAFTLDGRNSNVVAGNHGSQTAGDGGPAATASLFYPGTLALANGSLYINEAGGARIRQVVWRTGVISTAVQLVSGFLTDNGNEGLAAARDGTLFVQRGNVIARIYPNTTTPQPWAGGGTSNPGDPGPALAATLLAPTSLAVNPQTGDLAMADSKGNIIQVVDGSTGGIQTVAGAVHFAGDNGPAAMAIFNGLEGVVSDARGNIYVADTGNNRIRKIDTSGIVTTVAGNGINGFSGDNGPATLASLSLKHAAQFSNNLAIDSAGNLYISDYGNGRIRKIDTSGIITTVAGGGHAPLNRGSPATAASIVPGPLAVDPSGNIYFGNVYLIGSILGSAFLPTIYKIDATGLINPYAGGSGKDVDSGPALSTPIGYAYCLASDQPGNLYVCDTPNNRVRKVSPDGIMSTLAGNGKPSSGPITTGPAVASAIAAPTAVAADSMGDLFVYSPGQIVEIDGTATLQPVAGLGNAGTISNGDGGYASQATFVSIAGMTVSPSGNVYLSDGGIYLRDAMPVGAGGPPPIISSGGIVGAGASNPPTEAISPGGIVSIFGSNFSPPGVQHLLTDADTLSGNLPTSLGGICVSFGGVNASITGVFPDQINAQVPDLPPGPVTVEVTANCGTTSPLPGNVGGVVVNTASPEFFSSPGSGSGVNIIAATVTNGVVEAYGTGWGATSPAIPAGTVPGVAAQLVAPVEMMLGGVPVPTGNILYAGISPCCAGLYQVDFTIPDGTPSGNLPLVITVDGISSPANAYLSVP